MTQIVDEIRTLIESLYNDPADFLKGPHGALGGRPSGELMTTEEGQRELLRFLHAASQRIYMPPNEVDRDFKPCTDADIQFVDDGATKADRLVDEAIAHLEEKIEQFRSVKGSGPEITTVIERTQEVFGDLRVMWLVRHNQVLQTTPLDLISQGKTDGVLQLLGQIEYGVYV
jgi:hypothetical protein